MDCIVCGNKTSYETSYDFNDDGLVCSLICADELDEKN